MKKTGQSSDVERVLSHAQNLSESVQDMTLDNVRSAPKEETESNTRLSQNQIANSKDVFLKPANVITTTIKFNERFREDYEFDKQLVNFIADNKEQPGSAIETWTKKYPGIPAEFWIVPVNTPVWGPRYLAEQIRGCIYTKFVQQDQASLGSDGMASYHGAIKAEVRTNRLDAQPVSKRKSIFMGNESF